MGTRRSQRVAEEDRGEMKRGLEKRERCLGGGSF
jgi:hypothetical protein